MNAEKRVAVTSSRGALLALTGVLVLSPDTLMMRWSGLDPWPLVAWRGLLLAPGLLVAGCLLGEFSNQRVWSGLTRPAGWFVVAAFACNAINFTMGVAESSVAIVLTALATTPLIAAFLAMIFLREHSRPLSWITMIICLLGLALVVSEGSHAPGAPDGDPRLGAFFGLLTATGWAAVFVTARRNPDISLLPAAALGAAISAGIGLWASPGIAVDPPNLPWVLLMGLVILPVSFALFTLAPRQATAPVVSLIMLLEAILGPLWVWWGTGERLTPLMAVGAVIVLGALAVYLRLSQRKVDPRVKSAQP